MKNVVSIQIQKVAKYDLYRKIIYLISNNRVHLAANYFGVLSALYTTKYEILFIYECVEKLSMTIGCNI